MKEAALVLVVAVVVVFVVLVALEVGKRSSFRSPVDMAADLFTRTDVRNVAPVNAGAAAPMTDAATTMDVSA